MKSVAHIKKKVADLEQCRHLKEDIDYLKSKLARISSEPSTVRDELLRGAYVDLENAITKLQKLENHINQGKIDLRYNPRVFRSNREKNDA